MFDSAGRTTCWGRAGPTRSLYSSIRHLCADDESMRVFINSLIGGHFASLREAAAIGIGTLGYGLVRAEGYTVSPRSRR